MAARFYTNCYYVKFYVNEEKIPAVIIVAAASNIITPFD